MPVPWLGLTCPVYFYPQAPFPGEVQGGSHLPSSTQLVKHGARIQPQEPDLRAWVFFLVHLEKGISFPCLPPGLSQQAPHQPLSCEDSSGVGVAHRAQGGRNCVPSSTTLMGAPSSMLQLREHHSTLLMTFRDSLLPYG